MASELTPILNQLDYLPESLLTLEVNQLYRELNGPTLLHLPGKQAQPLFVSVLLHGNEPTGWLAVRALLQRYRQRTLPRSLSIFIGNVKAAQQRLRRLPDQADYNRVWPGTTLADYPEAGLMRQVFDRMAEKQPFASIDIHNNTGINPHYACINRLDNRFLHLATLFGRLVVYFTRPLGVQSLAFARLCPSVTLECGRPDQAHGISHALEYLEACLNLSKLPGHSVNSSDIDIYHTVAQVKVREAVRFGFDRDDVELALNPDIDHLNFTELAAGTQFGKTHGLTNGLPLNVQNERGQDVSREFFTVSELGDLVLNKPAMPSMLTLDEKVIRQDCLCYLMERIRW